jgi:hypothetical protein
MALARNAVREARPAGLVVTACLVLVVLALAVVAVT